MVNIIAGIACGFGVGAVIALIKHFFLWRPILTGKNKNPVTMNALLARLGLSNLLNIGAFAAAYFLKNILPFPLEFVLIGTALALLSLGRLSPVSKVMKSAGGVSALADTSREDAYDLPPSDSLDGKPGDTPAGMPSDGDRDVRI